MNRFRHPSDQEKALLVTLLQSKPAGANLIASLEDLVVQEMKDGGMGSLLLLPKGLENRDRSFGKQFALGEFTDRDGVQVSVALNLDKEGSLYELDLWKTDITPLIAWPEPSAVRMIA